MLLSVNPNRMELLKLRKRLALARRGHKLLQDKLEEIMRRFLLLLREVDEAKIDAQRHTAALQADALYLRLTSSRSDLEEALQHVRADIEVQATAQRIMNVRVPDLRLVRAEISRDYALYPTSGQLDVLAGSAADVLAALLRLAQLLKTLDILSLEIERTRRRVNALEHRLIPAIEETIRHITQKLNEFERGNLVRLMRVKEIVRSH